MPELPEVEIMARAMDRWTRGRRLVSLQVQDPTVLSGGALSVAGATVRGTRRRAKYVLVDLGAYCLVMHFRMTGKVVALASGESERAATRLCLQLAGEGPQRVCFVDPRRLGATWIVPAGEVDGFFLRRNLGPEPWPERHDGAWWAQALAGLRGPIKPALLCQDRVSGLGNICASESLWRAHIDPRTPVPAMTGAQWERLAAVVPAFIDEVIETEGALHDQAGELSYVNMGGPNPFAVYGRRGQPCPRCGAGLERLVQSGRATFWCPGCQSQPQDTAERTV